MLDPGEPADDPPPARRSERLVAVGRSLVLGAAGVAPAPGEQAHDDDAEGQPGERQQPGDQLEAALWRHGEHGRAELVDQSC